MGFTQKLGLLAQGVYSDSSLNVGIGGAPSGSYKFETTGTAKISSTLLVSGVVTFGSTLSNGTYTYTLPSATGTLALVGGAGVGTVTSVAALTLGTTGSDLSSTVANGTTTPVITLQVPTASATNRGALSSTDWTTFNSKESALTFSSPLVRTVNTISIPVATTSVNGYLSSTDWTTFNNKQGTITLTTTGTSGAATFSANTLNIPNYGSALSGYLPLTGGTLTGALTISMANYPQLILNSSNSNGATINIQEGGVTNAKIGHLTQITGLQFSGDGTNVHQTIASTGAATFINGAAKLFEIASNSATGGYTRFTYNTSTSIGYIGSSSQLSGSGIVSDLELRADNNLFLTTSGGSLKLASTGAATFSSTIECVKRAYVTGISTNAAYTTYTSTGNSTAYFGVDNSAGTEFIAGGSAYAVNIIGVNAYPMIFGTNNTEKMRITSGGLVGIGVTPNAWFTSGGYKVLQIGAGLSLDSGNDFRARLASNAYVNTSGDWAYANTGFASTYTQDSGQHVWKTAPSGVAGNAITFTERLSIAQTGAATFSSSVTQSYSVITGAQPGGLGANKSIMDFSGGTARWFSYGADASTNGAFLLNSQRSDGSNAISFLSIASTGAATFSSSIQTYRLKLVDSTSSTNFTLYTGVDNVNSIGFYNETTGVYNFKIGSTGAATFSNAATNGVTITNTTSSPSLISFTNTANGYSFGFNSTTTQRFVFINGGPTEIANINGTTGVYTALSDINKKKDFELSTIGLDAILGLKPTLYRMKSEDDTDKHLGFIAQEVKEFIPQAYSESGEGENKFIGLNEMPIIAALVNAIKELKAEIDLLKGEPIIPTDNNLE